jgi:pimeloyl-ACP methyl ester carboxylesterase
MKPAIVQIGLAAGLRAVIGTLAGGLVAVLVSSGCVHTAQFRDPQGHILTNSIASMEDVTIGGIAQRIWFRGRDRGNRALVLLHGGPGISEAALFRHYHPELERHFLVVYWEQRGAGRSFRSSIPPASMTIAQFLRDLDEVVELVRRRFDKDRVVLLGHSWGTVLGTMYAYHHPDKVLVYVGTGQIADMRLGEQLSYGFALSAARQRGHRTARSELEAIGRPPHSVEAMLTSRKWVDRFGGSFHSELLTGRLIWAALSTDEASVVDLVKLGQGNRFSLTHLWPELSALDLTQYRSFDVPVFFLLGRHDWQIPAVAAQAYFETIAAPCKRLVWFEGSAHHPPFEEPRKFAEILVAEVLTVATRERPPGRGAPSANPQNAVTHRGGGRATPSARHFMTNRYAAIFLTFPRVDDDLTLELRVDQIELTLSEP